MSTPLLALAAWLAPAQAGAGALPARQAVSEERLRAALEDARAALAALPGFELPAELRLVCTEPATVAQRVASENLPLLRLRESDPARAEAMARQTGEALAHVVYAKYAWSTRELLVVPALWEEQAQLLARPELTADAALRAVLVHELVHAWDDRRVDLTAFLAPRASNDAVLAASAVIEGHAQFRTRRACAERGWVDGFEAFTGSIGLVPESSAALGEGLLGLLRQQGASMASAYHDGERFLATLHAAGGDELVARVFREPPGELETILHPSWYLEPATRPAVLYDAEPALDLLAQRFPADVWAPQRVSLQSSQLAAGLALLPPETVGRVTGALRAGRALTLQPRAAPESKLVSLVVLEFDGESAARAFVEAAFELGERKDELMRQGVLRITDSEREQLELPGLTGFRQRLAMVNGTFAFEVATVDATRGRLVVEALFSGEPIDDAELVALAQELLAAVRLRADGAAPR